MVNPPPYDSTLALFNYQFPLDHLVLALKFSKKLLYARLMGELIADRLADRSIESPEVIIPVPLHILRLQERGYNQALEIARPISKRLNIPLAGDACQRVISTQPQAVIPAGQRQSNVKKAFSISPHFTAGHIALVDDVITTGSTMAELAQQFKKAGVKRVDVWCFAKTNLN